MQINTDYKRFYSNAASSVTELTTKKTITKVSENIRINQQDDDSASLSISDEHLAKKEFFQILMGLDDGMSIIATVKFNLASVSDIFSSLKQTHNSPEALLVEVDNIKNKSEFNLEKLLDGTFTKTLKLWLADEPELIIDFRNPLNGGDSNSSIDFDIHDIQAEGNLVSGLESSLDIIIVKKSQSDFNKIEANIHRMNEYALFLEARILDYYERLENVIHNLSSEHELSGESLNYVLKNVQKRFSEKSAGSMLTQIKGVHSNSTINLLP